MIFQGGFQTQNNPRRPNYYSNRSSCISKGLSATFKFYLFCLTAINKPSILSTMAESDNEFIISKASSHLIISFTLTAHFTTFSGPALLMTALSDGEGMN